jgi:hypothetical protein
MSACRRVVSHAVSAPSELLGQGIKIHLDPVDVKVALAGRSRALVLTASSILLVAGTTWGYTAA